MFLNQETAYNIRLPKYCSIFTAEMFAIKAALEIIIRENNVRKKDIIILSDSRPALLALQNNNLSVYRNEA